MVYAANFLQYGNALRVVRAEIAGMLNATANTNGIKIINDSDYDDNHYNNDNGGSSQVDGQQKFPDAIGNGVGVSICQTQLHLKKHSQLVLVKSVVHLPLVTQL